MVALLALLRLTLHGVAYRHRLGWLLPSRKFALDVLPTHLLTRGVDQRHQCGGFREIPRFTDMLASTMRCWAFSKSDATLRYASESIMFAASLFFIALWSLWQSAAALRMRTLMLGSSSVMRPRSSTRRPRGSRRT